MSVTNPLILEKAKLRLTSKGIWVCQGQGFIATGNRAQEAYKAWREKVKANENQNR